jgi:hypothetical protein
MIATYLGILSTTLIFISLYNQRETNPLCFALALGLVSEQGAFMADYGGAPNDKNPWTSLEVAKLVASLFTPIVVAIVGYFVWEAQQNTLASQTKAINAEQNETMRIREFRIEVYKKAGPLLNDIYAFHFHVGRWKEFTPAQIVEKKRELDALMYSNEPLLSPDFFDRYRTFMSAAFADALNAKGDARPHTPIACRTPGPNVDEWRAKFLDDDNRNAVCLGYRNLLEKLSLELLFQNLPRANISNAEKQKQCPHYDFSTCS